MNLEEYLKLTQPSNDYIQREAIRIMNEPNIFLDGMDWPKQTRMERFKAKLGRIHDAWLVLTGKADIYDPW